MSRYIKIDTSSDVTLIDKSNYSTNTSLNRRGINTANVSKISIVNSSSSVDVNTSIFLQAVEVTRTVNQANATTADIIFDEDIIISEADQIKVGDSCIDSDDTIHGTVLTITPSSKSIKISASVAITDNEVLSFRDPVQKLYIVDTVIPAKTTLVLDDSFSFNLNRYLLVIKPSGIGGTANLTIRID